MDKEKAEKMKELQQNFEYDTAAEKRQLEEIKTMIKCEEGTQQT